MHHLLSSADVIDQLTLLGADGRDRLWADIDAHSDSAGLPFTGRPTGGYARSALLDPGASCHRALREAYKQASTLVYGELPTFGACIDALRRHLDLL